MLWQKNKTLFWGILLAILLILHLHPLTRSGIPQTHDGTNHVIRFGAYAKAFHDHHLPPRWAGDLNYTFGTPVFIFFYPLPGSMGGILHLLGVPLPTAFNIITGAAFFLAPLFIYLWLSLLFSPAPAFVGALLFGLAPYQFLNLYVRGDVGELVALSVIPLVLIAVEKLSKTHSWNWTTIGGVFYAVLILSHNGISLMFSPVLFLWTILRTHRNRHFLIQTAVFFLIGLLLSSYFWVPVLIESRFTYADIFIGDMFRTHFLTLNQLLQGAWGFGAEVGKPEGLSPQIGLLPPVILVISLLLLPVAKNKSSICFWSAVFLSGIFLSLSVSSPLWEAAPILKKFQFPWRFIALIPLSAAVLGAEVFSQKKVLPFILPTVILLLVTNLQFARVQGYYDRPAEYYWESPEKTYYQGEATTRWSEGDPAGYPDSAIEIIGGEGAIANYWRNTWQQRFQIDAKTPVQILANTLYFPGWQVTVNNKKIPIEFQDANHRGLITFRAPQGHSAVSLEFRESPVRLATDGISILTAVALIIFFVIRTQKKNIHS